MNLERVTLILPWGMRNTIIVFSGPDGILLVDTGFSKHVLNSHPHGDHIEGKFLRFHDEADFAITGVMKDVPGNSHLQFDILVSLETKFVQNPNLAQDWLNINMPTYVLFRDRRRPFKTDRPPGAEAALSSAA